MLRCRHIKLLGFLIGSTSICTMTTGQPLDDPIPQIIAKGSIQIELNTIATGLTAPNVLTHARDGSGRLFVTEQNGTVRIINDDQLQPEPFLDVSARLVDLGFFGSQDENDFDERGLLGLAFHPDFADPSKDGYRKVYTYTSEPVSESLAANFTTAEVPNGFEFNHQSVITEWHVSSNNADVIDTNSRRELMRIDQPQFNHDGGNLAFGPDHYLYISLGDGGGGDDQDFAGGTDGHGANGNAQNTENIYGSVLRIDPLGNNSVNNQYGIPAENPFVNKSGLDEIYAYGFRNPFRFSFDVDPATGQINADADGRLILGDVGQNDIEEINIVTQVGNFGWRIKEGSFFFDADGTGSGFVTNTAPTSVPSDLIDPVAQYDHDQGDTGLAEGVAVIGGFVYRGNAIPELVGKYVFGDFAQDFDASNPSGRLFYADLETGQINEMTIGLDDRILGIFVNGIGQDDQGELYVLGGTAFGPFGATGVVMKIVAIPEPATVALLFVIAPWVVICRRRSARSARSSIS